MSEIIYELEKYKNERGLVLAENFFVAFESFSFQLDETARKTNDTDAIKLSGSMNDSCQIIYEFLNSMNNSSRFEIKARSIRLEDKILKGEHAGIVANIHTAPYTMIVNVHGGLRDPNHHLDEINITTHDFKMGLSHSSLTDRIASKPLNIGLQMRDFGGSKPFLDTWMTIHPDAIVLNTFTYLDEKSKLSSRFVSTSGVYMETVPNIRQATRELMQFIPNPYSPRV